MKMKENIIFLKEEVNKDQNLFLPIRLTTEHIGQGNINTPCSKYRIAD